MNIIADLESQLNSEKEKSQRRDSDINGLLYEKDQTRKRLEEQLIEKRSDYE